MEIPDRLLDKKIYITGQCHIDCNEPECPCLETWFELPNRRSTVRQLLESIARHYREMEET